MATTLGAVALTGGTAAASDYPPDDTSVTTVPQGGDTTPPRPAEDMPSTGSDTDSTLQIATGAVVAGAGLLIAARSRRRLSAD